MTNDEPCSCTYYIQEQAKYLENKSSLRKVKCVGCGKEFLTNKDGEKVHCFDCEGASKCENKGIEQEHLK